MAKAQLRTFNVQGLIGINADSSFSE